MAREIKFRAWDKDEKQYIDVSRFDISPYDGAVVDLGGYEYHEAVLEQYTGIDDRAGNPIHENDVVEMDYHKGDHTILDPQTLGMVEQYSDVDTIVRGVVHIWPSTGAIINNISSENPEQFVGDYRIPQYLHINKDCAVIGNIHKNPELLEKQNE